MTDKAMQQAASGNQLKDPADWVSGDEAMTGAQRSYLKTLSEEARQPFYDALTKADASRRIDELQRMLGRGDGRAGEASGAGAGSGSGRGGGGAARTVADLMTRGVRAMAPEDSVEFAAQAMDELNVGVVPVCDGDELVGIVTDRDIVVRCVAQGRPVATTPLREIISTEPECAHENDALDEVLARMGERQIRRLPVLDSRGRLAGMLSLGDVAAKDRPQRAAQALGGVSEPAEPDRSGNSAASGAAGGGSASGRPSRMPGG